MNKYNKQRLFEMMNKVSGMPLMEIDKVGRFPDLKDGRLNPEETVEILNYFLERKKEKPWKRGKVDRSRPYIHASNIPIKLYDDPSSEEDFGQQEIDLEGFIDLITKEPIKFLTKNEKIQKTAYGNVITYNTGLPAFRGLVFDEDNKEFLVVNTCTGAGTCLSECYAKKGSYVMFPAPNLKPIRILNYLLNNPDGFERKAYNEIHTILNQRGFKKKIIYIRWNDSGDFFVNEYFRIALDVTKRLREEGFDNLYSYAHTKSGDVYNQGTDYFIMNFSTNANAIERSKVNLDDAKTSEYVPKKLFDDLFLKNTKNTQYVLDETGKLVFKDPVNGPKTLKEIISKEFDVDINSLLFVDELIKTPPQEGVVWNVIVLPKGDGDNAAQRTDVKRTFLMHH